MINHHAATEAARKAGGPIHIKPSKEGSLHKEMGVKEGHKISTSSERKSLAAAKKSGNVAKEKKLVFALNAKKWHH